MRGYASPSVGFTFISNDANLGLRAKILRGPDLTYLSKKAPLLSFFDPYSSKISLMLPMYFRRVIPPHQLTDGRFVGRWVRRRSGRR